LESDAATARLSTGSTTSSAACSTSSAGLGVGAMDLVGSSVTGFALFDPSVASSAEAGGGLVDV
jgi:hypothetical protein